jgi:hypothetical protein
MKENKTVSTIITVVTFPLWGSMILAAIALLLSIYLIMWCVPAASVISAVALIAVGLLGTVGSPIVMTQSIGAGFTQLGVSLLAIGAAILLAILAWEVGRKIVFLTISTLKKISAFKSKAGVNGK